MFKPVDPKPDFPKLERKLLKWWYQSGVVKKYLQKNSRSKKNFSFLDGPITANNPMGVHHAWGRTYKDLWQRFNNMRGYQQRFQNGFDNQGLWVEVEVEKELGFKSKKEIEEYGIAKFVNKCKGRTLRFAQVQTEQSKRLGYFMDWDNSYYTMSDENNYMIWHFLKKCWQDGNLYKGRDSVPWCPRCGTAISQHEILQEEYKKSTHDSVYFKLPITGNRQFLVWTTTPWTIPANVALAVNPEFVYGEFKKKGEKETLIFLKDLKSKVLSDNWQLIKQYKGKELKGWQYQGPFDDLPQVKKAQKENPKTFHTVVLDKELVTATEGTGIVHIAPGAGQEDFQLGKRENLPVIAAIDEEAKYLDSFGKLSGKNAKEQPDLIFDYLKKKEGGRFLFKIEPYTHRYPVCWRCKTELVWRVVEEWYIAMDDEVKKGAKNYRQRMMKVAKKIYWQPSWGLERELDWLKNMDDWLISKKRYWGLALPIWECSCGHFEVIGSKEELKERNVSGWKKFDGYTPHRPWIDEIKIKCSQCGKTASRIPDVGNPWLDAGIVSFSTLKYRTKRDYWRQWFPADFITENFHGQFKNWFYSLIAMSTVLKDREPFKTVLAHALVRDEKGEEMHKSKGNAIDFDEAAEKMGVDVMRWLYVRQNPELNLNFGYHLADEVRRQFHLLFWNIYKFFISYALVDNWQPKGKLGKSKHVLDQWILSRLNQLIKTVTDSLTDYRSFTAAREIEGFVNDLSTWYLRRSRNRVGPTAEDKTDKENFYSTLHFVLVTLSKLLAPFNPFFAEEIFKNLTGGESVHLKDWPEPDLRMVDESLEKEMKQARQVVESAHSQRKKEEIKVRQPLGSLATPAPMNLSAGTATLVMDEVNVKRLVVDESIMAEGGPITVKLDTKLTPELKAEGEARELVRQIQELRKEKGCRLDEKIIVFLPSWPKKFESYIKKQTLAKKLLKAKKLKISA
jgi:isoleucyl-tRNA synthetase